MIPTCSGSEIPVTDAIRAVVGRLGITQRFAVCPSCNALVLVRQGQIIEHQPAERALALPKSTVLLTPAQQRIRARLQRTAGVA
jgi:hypothetical protein